MFETVGRTEDPEARRRHVASVGLTTALLAAGIGFQVGLATWFVTELVAPPDDDDTLIVMIEPSLDEEELGAAPPPPPPRGSAEAERVEASEPTDEVAELEPEVPETVRDVGASDAPGVEDGHADGVEGGHPDGVPLGTGDTPGGKGLGGTGDGTGGPRVVHHAELRRIRAIDPRYPKAAQGMGLGRVTCDARVVIDERGVPADVDVTGCPALFHAEIRAAVLKSRWASPRFDGERRRVQTLLRFHFQER